MQLKIFGDLKSFILILIRFSVLRALCKLNTALKAFLQKPKHTVQKLHCRGLLFLKSHALDQFLFDFCNIFSSQKRKEKKKREK